MFEFWQLEIFELQLTLILDMQLIITNKSIYTILQLLQITICVYYYDYHE